MDDVARIACFFHPEDATYFEELLKSLLAIGAPPIWSPGSAALGESIPSAMRRHLEQAPMLVFLISSDFLASKEMQDLCHIASRRSRAGEVRLVLIRVRPVEIDGELLACAHRQLPLRAQALSLFEANRREAEVLSIAQVLRDLDRPRGVSGHPQAAGQRRLGQLTRSRLLVPLVSLSVLPVVGLLLFRITCGPDIQELQRDEQGRRRFEVTGTGWYRECLDIINGDRKPAWRCGRSHVVPPDPGLHSLGFSFDETRYDVNLDESPVHLRRAKEE